MGGICGHVNIWTYLTFHYDLAVIQDLHGLQRHHSTGAGGYSGDHRSPAGCLGKPQQQLHCRQVNFVFFCVLGTKPPQPHSGLSPGAKAKAMINQSRENVARMVGGRADDIIFTSGGTEVKQLSVRLGTGWYWASSRGSRFFDLLPGQQSGPPHSGGALLEELRSFREGRRRPSSHHHLQRGA